MMVYFVSIQIEVNGVVFPWEKNNVNNILGFCAREKTSLSRLGLANDCKSVSQLVSQLLPAVA